MLTQVHDDRQLRKLLSANGFLVNADYPTRDVKLHSIHCRYCSPDYLAGVKPSSKRKKETGEFWYADNRKEAHLKAVEIAEKQGFIYSTCTLCKP